jgi:hypothetical protein
VQQQHAPRRSFLESLSASEPKMILPATLTPRVMLQRVLASATP